MAETLDKKLDDMEEVTEGTTQSKTAVNKAVSYTHLTLPTT